LVPVSPEILQVTFLLRRAVEVTGKLENGIIGKLLLPAPSAGELTENPTFQALLTKLLDSPAVSGLERSFSLLRYRSQARQSSDWPPCTAFVELVLRSAGQVSIFQPSLLALR
jgi:hypothetical protein